MATGDYTSDAALAAELGIEDSKDDGSLALAVSAASRQIDGFCGRRFWQDSAVVVREFYADSPTCCDLLEQPGDEPATEISTVTGLVVKTDEAADGTFGTTLTIGTDFVLLPRNAAADSRGFSEILLVGGHGFPRSSNGRAGVQVTAKFGWPAVPGDVQKACLIQAAQLHSSKDAVFGAIALGESQATYLRSSLNVTAKALLARYQVVPLG